MSGGGGGKSLLGGGGGSGQGCSWAAGRGCELPVSSDVHPAVRNAGAEVAGRVVAGGSGGLGGAAGAHSPLGGTVGAPGEPTDAHPLLLEAVGWAFAGGGAGTEDTVAHPDFLNPDGFASSPVEVPAVTSAVAAGLTILTPAAFAALLSSFSSLLRSFSLRSSASDGPANPFALVVMSFIRALWWCAYEFVCSSY